MKVKKAVSGGGLCPTRAAQAQVRPRERVRGASRLGHGVTWVKGNMHGLQNNKTMIDVLFYFSVYIYCTKKRDNSNTYHAKNKFVGRIIPFVVLRFWDKNTGMCAGAMPYRRDFPATTGI